MHNLHETAAHLSAQEKRRLLAQLLRQKANQNRITYPLSYGQEALWFLYKLTPQSCAHNINLAVRIRSTIDISILRQSLQHLVDRHSCLRTTFTEENGLKQIAAGYQEAELTQIDASNWSEDELHHQVTSHAHQPFVLEQGPLLRTYLFSQGEQDHLLLLTLHHIICDAQSVGILIRELSAVYSSLQAGQPPSLPTLTYSYADFVRWQQQMLAEQRGEQQVSYWQEALAGDLPRLDLPALRGKRSALSRTECAQAPFHLSSAVTRRCQELAETNGTTLQILFLAAFQILLSRYTGQEDLLVGIPVAGRSRPEFREIVGYFVNAVALRVNLADNPTFTHYLQQVRQTVEGALTHQDSPFAQLVERLQPAREPNCHPIFQVNFNFVPPPESDRWRTPPDRNQRAHRTTGSGLNFEPYEVSQQEGLLDLDWQLSQADTGITGWVKYRTKLFDNATIERMIGHYLVLLNGILADPSQPVAHLPLLTEAERHQLLITWNETATPYPRHKCIHHLFEEQVVHTPDAIALIYKEQELTYFELNLRANAVAGMLMERGVAPETLVGCYMEQSSALVIALLGILKAGGVYLPLDPTLPSERLSHIIADAGPLLVLTRPDLVSQISTLVSAAMQTEGPQILVLDALTTAAGQPPPSDQPVETSNPESNVGATNLAYVVYTSGSTGVPNGVMVEHRSLCNVALAMGRRLNIHGNSRMLQFLPIGFDGSIGQLLTALIYGASVYVAPEEASIPGPAMLALLRREAITLVALPPSALAVWPPESLPALETIISAGEALTGDFVARWAPGRCFVNGYGPTENTIGTTIAICTDREEPRPPIGRPLANIRVYILDKYLQPVPLGVPGELYIGGEGLARGYLNRPDLTEERFIPNPFNEPGAGYVSSKRLYKTGDVVRYRPDLTDGAPNIEFLGRLDNQVKIRGFRVELGEIEEVLAAHPAVRSAAVVVRKDRLQNQQLAAYIVRQQTSGDCTSSLDAQAFRHELRVYLKQKLPSFMVPAAVVELEALPLTPNGKTDRQALATADDFAPRNEKASTLPRAPLEKQLAEIWAEVLDIEQVGVWDDFFEVGGHSLAAVRVVNQIKQRLGHDVPLLAFLERGTIAGLAQVLESAVRFAPNPTTENRRRAASLVPLNRLGTKPPLFLVHPLLGVVFPYVQLAARLGVDQPVYALQSVGLADGQSFLTSIEEMAAHYVEAMRQVQPHGPYQLGGWSLGGVIALEMAQQLRQTEEPVALLAILDTPATLEDCSIWQKMVGGLSFTNLMLRNVWQFVDVYLEMHQPQHHAETSKLARVSQKMKLMRHVGRSSRKVGAAQEEASADVYTMGHLTRLLWTNLRAANHYQLKPYLGSVKLLRAENQMLKTLPVDLGWGRYAKGGVDIRTIPGNHFSLLQPPQVQKLAEHLQQLVGGNGLSA